jgi:hypothetical protein
MDAIVTESALSGEHVGYCEAAKRFRIPENTLRGYVRTGLLRSFKTPNRRVWLKVRDIEALFEPVTPKPSTQ